MKNRNWWKKTFGKAYKEAFDSIYSKERTESEVNFILDNIKLKKGINVLDIACGAGRHSIELAKKGFNVTGIDYSKDLLNEAKKRAAKKILKINFILGDIRSFHVHGSQDLVIMMGNSFGYFDNQDNEKVLKNINEALKPGGYFVLDLPNTRGILRNINTVSQNDIPSGYVLTKNLSYDESSKILSLYWEFYLHGKKSRYFGELYLYSHDEIEEILNKHNFKIIKETGSYDGIKYSIDSPRLILIAQKI